MNAAVGLAILALAQLGLTWLAGLPLTKIDRAVFVDQVRAYEPLGIKDFFITDVSGDGGVAPAPAVANAFTVIPLDGSRTGRIQETTAPPTAVAWAPGSDHALITVSDPKLNVYGAYLVGNALRNR